MEYRSQVAHIVAQGLAEMGQSIESPVEMPAPDEVAQILETPRDRSLGDYAFGCFRMAKAFRQAPVGIAQTLAESIRRQLQPGSAIAEVQAVGPYLNFKLNRARMAAEVLPAILNGSFLDRRPLAGERVMIEYSQPNTHKAFHVGHTRNVALGDALVRLFRWSGCDVVAANYIGDVGAHIAKCLWYFQTRFDGPVPEENRGEFLGDLYQKATELLDFTLLTRTPVIGVVSARVTDIATHPHAARLRLVTVDWGEESACVVCGGTGYQVGDLVAYAKPGSRIDGRLVTETPIEGVLSCGMICSERETGISSDQDQILVLDPNAPVGVEIGEIHRIPGALDERIPVHEEMQRRTREVAQTLQKMESKDPQIHRLWMQTRAWSMQDFTEIYRFLDCRFDHFFFESEVGDEGKAMVQEGLEKGVLVESEGVIGADLESFGLPFLMLLKSDGTGLYATKDLALAKRKFEDFGVDRSVYVVDASQTLHFQQVFKTLELLGFERARQCFHLPYGLVVLPEGKMSSRSGTIILFSQLRHRLCHKITSEYLEKYRGDWPDSEIEEAARKIAVATIKYGMLNQDNQRNIIFELDEWTSRSGNTGPYLLYAYTRTRSILAKMGGYDLDQADFSLLNHPAEEDLVEHLARFPEIAQKACQEYKPQLICVALFRLCKDFSRMFDLCPVIQAPTAPLRAARAALVDAVGRLLESGLNLLGIEVLRRM